MRSIFFVVLFIIIFFNEGRTQCLNNVTSSVNVNFTTTFTNGGRGVTVYDLNKDGWDDIIFASAFQPIVLYTNTGNYFSASEIIPNDQDVKEVLCFDFDNDGDADIFLTAYIGTCKMFRNDGDLNFTDITESCGILYTPGGHSFGASAGDYNNDGWLDLYVSNNMYVNYTNLFYENNGDGTFTEKSAELGIDNGMHATMMAVFFDYNNDSFQDIYVMNDHGDGDAIYSNNGDGTFSDISLYAQITDYSNSMSIGICDFDNDSDQDVYISSTASYGNIFYRNNGDSTFTNMADELGIQAYTDSWSSLWIDLNNDRFHELYVANDFGDYVPTGPPNIDNFYWNNEGVFSPVPIVFPAEGFATYGASRGDFNNDGLPDFVITTGENEMAQIYESSCGGNSSIKVTLEGVASNRDGIGSRIESWAGGTQFHQYTFAGESYMDQYSQHIIVPLGSQTVLDSLKIHWPSGWTDVFYNVATGTNLYIIEGSSLQTAQLNPVENTQICGDESITLSVNGTWSNVEWSNGSTLPELAVTQSGNYFANVTNEFNQVIRTDTVSVVITENPTFTFTYMSPDCFNADNGSIEVTIEPGSTIEWNDQSTVSERNDLQAGYYSFVVSNSSGCTASGSAFLINPDPIVADVNTADLLCSDNLTGEIYVDNIFGGVGILSCQLTSGGSNWTTELNNNSALFSGLPNGNFQVMVTDENACTFVENVSLNAPNPLVVEASGIVNEPITAEVSGGTPPFTFLWCDASAGDFIILDNDSISCMLQVTDNNGCAATTEVNVMVGIYENHNLNPKYYFIESRLYIQSSEEINSAVLYDATGQLCHSTMLTSSSAKKFEFDFSDYPNGIYFVLLSNNSGMSDVIKVMTP
jgi:hypothetical protein